MKDGEDVYIGYHSLPEAFRALGKALEHVRAGKWREENPGVRGHKGFMFDCSRNGVLRVEAVKKLIRQTALMGLDWFLLYTEDTYEVEGYPYFGALRGRYTKEEIRACDAYAALFGVEMIPCIQDAGPPAHGAPLAGHGGVPGRRGHPAGGGGADL